MDCYCVTRGRCSGCEQCEAFMVADVTFAADVRVLCLYCGCPPAKHARVAEVEPEKVDGVELGGE